MKSFRISSLVLALAVVGAAHADLAYSSFPFVEGNGWTIASPSSIVGYQSAAMQFNSAVSGDVTSVDFASFGIAGSGNIHFSMFSDNGSGQVGSLLGDWDAHVDTDGVSKIYSSNAPAGITLASGQNYWLGMAAQDDTWNAWNMSSSVQGNIAFNFDSAPFYNVDRLSAFAVNAQAVPEPASMAALGIGVVAVLRRRTKRA